MLKVTVWETIDKEGVTYHNHIEDGWVEGSRPRPRSDLQRKSWNHGHWRKRFAYLNDNKEIVYP